MVFKILKSPYTGKLTFLSMRGTFFHKLALVEQFKDIFLAQILTLFLAVCYSQVVKAIVLKLILLFNQAIVHASTKSKVSIFTGF